MNQFKPITAVLGLAINADRQFLITQRNQPEYPNIHQKWQIPGGEIEFGEKPLDTLIRELDEELNLTPSLLFPFPMTNVSVFQHGKSTSSVILLCYLVYIGQQIPGIRDPETLDWKWTTETGNYRLNSLPLTKIFIDEAIQICNRYSLWPKTKVIK